jgi:hypothetical protein
LHYTQAGIGKAPLGRSRLGHMPWWLATLCMVAQVCWVAKEEAIPKRQTQVRGCGINTTELCPIFGSDTSIWNSSNTAVQIPNMRKFKLLRALLRHAHRHFPARCGC